MFEIKKEEYVNKTFRLKKSLVEDLEKVASENSVPLNRLVAQSCQYALENMKCNAKDSANNQIL